MQSFIANFNMGSLNPIGVFELVDCLRGQAGLWIRATCYRTFSLEPTMADCVNEWALWKPYIDPATTLTAIGFRRSSSSIVAQSSPRTR
jgi:hypothetical protein